MRHTIIADKEMINYLPSNYQEKFCFIDCTYGKGLHCNLILKHYPNSFAWCIDYDNRNLIKDEFIDRKEFIHDNFVNIFNLNCIKWDKVLFILIDFDVHMDQILSPDYGMSYQNQDFKINFLVNNTFNDKKLLNGSQILNSYNYKQLHYMFKNYGNLSNSSLLANKIINYRKYNGKIENIGHIINATKCNVLNNNYKAKIFQSIRIECNKQIENMIIFFKLLRVSDIIKNNNKEIRIFSLTFNSLEDKIVKNFTKNINIEDKIAHLYKENNIKISKMSNKVINYVAKSHKIVFKNYENRRKDFFFIFRIIDLKKI